MIIAWATPTIIPRAWLDQAKPGTVICTPVYYAETAKSTAHVRATVTAARNLTGITLGGASYVDMGAEVNSNLGMPMFYIDATRDCGGKPSWISVAWRGRHPGHNPLQPLTMLSEPGHREPCGLASDTREQRRAWRDFRTWCTARDGGTNLTTYGIPDGDTAIGFSSGNNAAVLADTGTIIASTPASPALVKLLDHLHDLNNADRPD